MVRNTLVAIAMAAVLVVGCDTKKTEVSLETSKPWNDLDSNLNARLTAVKGMHTDFEKNIATPVTNTGDTAAVAARASMETKVKANATAIADVEKTRNRYLTVRDSLMKLGDAAAFEASWKAAEADYRKALARLEQIEKDYVTMRTSMNTNPGTSTNGTVNMKDTTKGGVNASVSTTDKGAEGQVKVGDKTVGRVDVNLKDPSKPTVRVEPGKDDNKPLIEKNKNPK